MTKDFNQPDQYVQLTEQVINILSSLKQPLLLYKILDSLPNSKKWITSAFSIALNKDLRQFFTSDVFISRWKYFNDELEEEEYKLLIEYLVRDTAFIPNVIDSGFIDENICLYVSIIENGGASNKEFTNWCINNLHKVQFDRWKSEFEKEGELLDLIITLIDQDVVFKLIFPIKMR